VTPAVVDASIAITWCFQDQATPETDRLLDKVRDEGAVAPALWRLERADDAGSRFGRRRAAAGL
jgi:hypothetical protein